MKSGAQGSTTKEHRPIPQTPKPAAWTPPKTSLPQELVDAASFMLEHGLGDPRGGKLVKAKVIKGETWRGGGEPAETYGWLLPASGKDKPRLVSADGLVYDPVSVEGDAKVEDAMMAPVNDPRFVSMYPSRRSLWPVLLLIHGDTALAESTYEPPRNQTEPGSIFRSLTNDYLTNRFHRAVEAHMRGDDLLALLDSEALRKDRDAYEKEAAKRLGPPWVERQRMNPQSKDPVFVYRYLQPVDALFADSQRRYDAGPRKPIDFTALKALSPKDRVATLIDHLDEVAARQWGQPGGVNVFDDPIVKALVDEGNAAGEPLLDAIEKDTRLTRSVSFGRDFWPDRNLITVKTAAYGAFKVIVQVDEFTNDGGQPDLKALRAYWAQNKNATPAERWYKTLADDSAGRRKWMEAAARLVEPTSVTHVGTWTTMENRKPGDPEPPMKGEPLRSSTPSISNLMAKRITQIADGLEQPGYPHQFELTESLRLSLFLYKWDSKSALDSLRNATRKSMNESIGQYKGHLVSALARPLGEAIEARFKLGDDTVLDEYVGWLGQPDIQNVDRDSARIFAPMIEHGDLPAIKAAARKAFTKPGSPWNLAEISKKKPGENNVASMVISPILALDPVRETVVKILSDQTSIGQTWVEGKMMMTSHAHGNSGQGLNDDKPDPLAPPNGEKRDYRVCDNMAMTLARDIKGAPKFRPYWPKDVKDRVIREMAAYLNQNKDKIASLISWPNNWKDHPDNFPRR